MRITVKNEIKYTSRPSVGFCLLKYLIKNDSKVTFGL